MFDLKDVKIEEKKELYKALNGKNVTCHFQESEDGWTFCLARDNGLIYLLDMKIVAESMSIPVSEKSKFGIMTLK